MTKTRENGIFALACMKGLLIVKSKDKKSLSLISSHLKDSNFNAISYVKDKQVILAVWYSSKLIVFDYSKNQ